MSVPPAIEQTFDGPIEELRGLVADLGSLDLWPPDEMVRTVVSVVGRMIAVASRAPEPAPEPLRDAAVLWRHAGRSANDAATDLRQVVTGLAPAWSGPAGDAARACVGELARRVATAPEATTRIASALDSCADAMRDARARHENAFAELQERRSISWSLLLPWEAFEYLRGIVAAVIGAADDLIGAYDDADAAVRAATRRIRGAIDLVELPHALLPGTRALDTIDLDRGDDGPLRGTVPDRARQAYDALSPTERDLVDRMLEGAPADVRAWTLAALASGLGLASLGRFREQLDRLTPAQRAALDPTTHPGDFKQPNQVTCGAASLVFSRMLNDPAYAMMVMTGYDPRTGDQDPSGDASKRFTDETLAMHDRVTSTRDHDGDQQVPWLKAAGTSPWGAEHQMEGGDGSSGIGGDYGTRLLDPDDLAGEYDRIVTATDRGHTVPLYVGDGVHPGHVVMIVGATEDTLTIYEPAAGEKITVTRSDFENGTTSIAGWDTTWLTVLPE